MHNALRAVFVDAFATGHSDKLDIVDAKVELFYPYLNHPASDNVGERLAKSLVSPKKGEVRCHVGAALGETNEIAFGRDASAWFESSTAFNASAASSAPQENTGAAV